MLFNECAGFGDAVEGGADRWQDHILIARDCFGAGEESPDRRSIFRAASHEEDEKFAWIESATV